MYKNGVPVCNFTARLAPCVLPPASIIVIAGHTGDGDDVLIMQSAGIRKMGVKSVSKKRWDQIRKKERKQRKKQIMVTCSRDFHSLAAFSKYM